jgi:hypothetical protein
MRKRALWVAVLSAGLLWAAQIPSAFAGGAVIEPARLSHEARAALVAEIQSARKSDPRTFEAVERIRQRLAEFDAQKQGRLAPITSMLKAVGPGALFPMLEHIAIESPARGDLQDTAWIAWRTGLIEAAGMLRDGRSAAVFAAILDSPETEFYVTRAAASAYGKLGTDEAAAKLVSMAKTAGPKQKAVLAGMGDCRRTVVAEALAQAIAAHPDEETARLVVRSLSDVGSSWAWKTPIVAQSGEEASTRAIAAKALVGAFVAYAGEVRQKASNALMVVDDPSTPGLIAAARTGASPDVQAALDKLAERFARNPVR